MKFNFRRYSTAPEAGRRSGTGGGGGTGGTGDPLREEETARGARVAVPPPGAYEVGRRRMALSNPRLKAPGTERLELNYDEPPSNLAFKFKLRRYNEVGDPWRKRPDPRRRSEAFISKEYRFQVRRCRLTVSKPVLNRM